MLECRYGCKRQFKCLKHMEDHKLSFHDGGMMKCRYGCQRLFRTVDDMKAHKLAFHDGKAANSHVKVSKPEAKNASPSPAPSKKIIAGGSSNAIVMKNQRTTTACNDCRKEFSSVEALRQHQMTQPGHTRPAKHVGSSGCEACNRTLRNQDSLEQHFVEDHSVIELPPGDSARVSLEVEFRKNWKKPTPCGTVQHVFKIYNSGWRRSGYSHYGKSLKNGENEVNRYHGTSLLCDLGLAGQKSKLCQLLGCNFCSILRSGFKTAKARTGWLRFGKGIYTTATSGKSDDYVRITSTSSRRAVLVCKVLAGKVFRTQISMPEIEAPPEGYDSVSGEVGKDLNYDETVVYKSKAILPAYMIVYS